MFKIRYKLLLVLIGVSLVPQLIINQISLDKIETTINEKFSREADASAESIQQFMADTLSKNERNILSMERNMQYIYGDDQKIVKADMEQLVRVVQESSGSTPNFYIGTSEGEMFLYPDSLLPTGYDPRMRSWYQVAELSKDKINWFGPYIDQGTKQLVLTVSKYYQYKDKSGVIGIDILITNLREELKTESLGKKGEIFIMDNLGEIILHNNQTFEGLNVKYTKYIEQGLDKAVTQGIYQGEQYTFKVHKLSDTLLVVTVVNKEEIIQLVNEQMNQMRTVPVVFVILTLGIIIFFSDRLTRPIYMIIEGMKKAEQGDYEIHLNYKGNDEIKLLTDQFNQMAQGIKSGHEEMTALYEELTASEETLQDQYDELIRNRDQIAESERRYKLVFDASNEGLWDIDQNNLLSHYSPNWFNNYFIDSEIKQFSQWTDLIHPEDRSRFLNNVERHIHHQTPYFHEVYRVLNLKGQYRTIQTRGKAEFDVDDHMITLAGSHLDVTEQKNNEAQILKMAFFDQVTELANRQNFERELNRYFEQHLWGRIIYLDISTFKTINENHGYLLGDEILKDLSIRLTTAFGNAFIARVAGDEFAVIIEGMTDDEALNELMAKFQAPITFYDKTGELLLTYQLKVVQCKFPNDGKNTEELMTHLMTKMKFEKQLT